ncbi:hypothetical protein PV661_02700 [Streptomyces sp. MD20-1-1]|uniref:hypothetical protein n=1 Tax=Streptomyces sp. MD20-1-1 TaxID=3028668 RepID=UPI0029B12B48|nr:hypothetical protein [Streptomyces sp. MD20-1-1]
MTDRTDEGTAARERADFLTALMGPMNEDMAALAWGCICLAVLAHGPSATDADILADALSTLEGVWSA